MRLDERDRRSLHNALADLLGQTHADSLMNLLPTHPLAEMATREDLHSLATALRGEMAQLRGDMRTEMAELRAEMVMGFAAVEVRFGAIDRQFGAIDRQFGELRTELGRDMRTNTLMLMMMNIAVLAIIVTLGLSGAFA